MISVGFVSLDNFGKEIVSKGFGFLKFSKIFNIFNVLFKDVIKLFGVNILKNLGIKIDIKF